MHLNLTHLKFKLFTITAPMFISNKIYSKVVMKCFTVHFFLGPTVSPPSLAFTLKRFAVILVGYCFLAFFASKLNVITSVVL